jgi:heme/copper-type cytochrome/quinol oxidase subunit 2
MDLIQTADQAIRNWILKVTVSVLAAIVIIVVAVMMIGIFLPNEQISNDKILEMIGPAFNTVIGAFVGLLGGMQIGKMGESKEPPTAPEPPKVEEKVEAKVEEDDGIDHSKPIEEDHKDDNRWSDDHHDEHLADHVAKHS